MEHTRSYRAPHFGRTNATVRFAASVLPRGMEGVWLLLAPSRTLLMILTLRSNLPGDNGDHDGVNGSRRNISVAYRSRKSHNRSLASYPELVYQTLPSG